MAISLPRETWTQIQQCWTRISKTLSKLDEKSLDEDVKFMNNILVNDNNSIETETTNISSNEFVTLMNEIDRDTNKNTSNEIDFDVEFDEYIPKNEKKFISKPVCNCMFTLFMFGIVCCLHPLRPFY